MSTKQNRASIARPKLSHALLAMLIEELMDGATTSLDLVDRIGLRQQTVNQILRALHKRGVIHICGWEKDTNGRTSVRAFRLGRGKDAPRPTKPRTLRNRDYARRRREKMLPAAFAPMSVDAANAVADIARALT